MNSQLLLCLWFILSYQNDFLHVWRAACVWCVHKETTRTWKCRLQSALLTKWTLIFTLFYWFCFPHGEEWKEIHNYCKISLKRGDWEDLKTFTVPWRHKHVEVHLKKKRILLFLPLFNHILFLFKMHRHKSALTTLFTDALKSFSFIICRHCLVSSWFSTHWTLKFDYSY